MTSENARKAHIKQKIAAIDWSCYETAYSSLADTPFSKHIENMKKFAQSFTNLFSDDKTIALQASHALWCALCHQHAYVSSAALLAYDILYDGLQILDTDLQMEILDIFYGFAACTTDDAPSHTWQSQLRSKLKQDIQTFQQLTQHPNEDITVFAQNIISTLQEPKEGLS